MTGGASRREFLRGALGTAAAGLAGLGCGDEVAPFREATSWRAGDVAHLLPTVDHRRIRLKASFARPLASAPSLHIAGRPVAGEPTDSGGRFFAFDAGGLEPDTEYTLALRDASGEPLCDPWPLRTFPHPRARLDRFRLLVYTCAGGHDWFRHPIRGRIFQPTAVRRRLLARALAYSPDAVIANGDHVYWDVRSSGGIGLGRSPQAWLAAGWLDRGEAVLGTDNEVVLRDGFGPQIAGVYGTLFRSVPVFFLQDDHDYTENDEASEELRTFPADRFMLDVARATQRLYYPELLTPDGVAESSGTLRYGRLFEGLLYDCRRALTNDADPATGHERAAFVAPETERWLRWRTARGETEHLAHVPSTPVLWTAGKWGEWYPDVLDASGALSIREPKPFWPRGWLEQHDRLLAAASARRDRIPLFVSGDLHATGAGRILRTGETSLEDNPVVSVLAGTIGTAGPGWPSRFRGTRPRPSLAIEAEEWQEPLEENGFSLLDFTPEGVRLVQFRWTREQGVDAIHRLEPFAVREIGRVTG